MLRPRKRVGEAEPAARVRAAARALLAAVAEEERSRALSPQAMARTVRELGRLGRPLGAPALLGSGGRGTRARLADGRECLDFIGGIGVYAFGHADPDLLETAAIAAAKDSAFQGHLAPGLEVLRLSRAPLRHAGPRLARVWLSVSGAMANENALKIVLQRHHPGRVAAMLFELVQGEGGVHTAPREFFLALMRRCREAGVAVWVDEVQTFARTGELFAFRTLGLEREIDVATAGTALQGSAVLFAKHYTRRPGLVAGTYAGATVGMAVGARIIERLESDGFLGRAGRIARLGRRVAARAAALRRRLPRQVGAHDGIGAIHALTVFGGDAAAVQRAIAAAFERGLLLAGFAILEQALRAVARERGVRC